MIPEPSLLNQWGVVLIPLLIVMFLAGCYLAADKPATRSQQNRRPMTDIDIFNEARTAGMPPVRAARYVHHVHQREREGRTPLTPEQAAAAPLTTPTPKPGPKENTNG